MSKAEQNKSAQKVKAILKKLGVKQRFQVEQGVGFETIVMWVYEGKFQDDDNSLKIHFDETGYVTRLTYDEDSTIIEYPSEEQLAEYFKKHWNH